MADILAAILWPATVAWLGHRAIALFERRLAPQREGRPDDDIVIPDDLQAVAMQYRQDWAQAETLAAIKDKYRQYRDWDKVRVALGYAKVRG